VAALGLYDERMRQLIYALPLLLLAACGSSTSTPDSSTTAVDMVMTSHGSDGGLRALAAMCTADSQCASNVCAPYKMGAYQLCTLKCTPMMSAPQCTAPSDGTCNGMGYCKFPGM
jgi:hypothetical protein